MKSKLFFMHCFSGSLHIQKFLVERVKKWRSLMFTNMEIKVYCNSRRKIAIQFLQKKKRSSLKTV